MHVFSASKAVANAQVHLPIVFPVKLDIPYFKHSVYKTVQMGIMHKTEFVCLV